MRLFVAAVAVAVLGLVATTTTADAKDHRSARTAKHKRDNTKKRTTPRIAKVEPARRGKGPQSFGAPWNGKLANATRLTLGDGAHIRRPQRAYGTRTTVEHTKRAVEETIALHKRAHVLAIGDISAEHGGPISDHQSHQSGRDVDLGLFYKRKPDNYPTIFIDGTAANLDCAATWTLVNKLANTANKDGGVWAIFLDFEVQGVLYKWAKDHGVKQSKLEKVFQYPHGRGANAGIVRHYRNHAHHLHVRFKCTAAETNCQ